VTGIDFSTRSIQYAIQDAEKSGSSIRYGNRNYLDFETEARFGLVLMIMCDFCALSPKQRSLQESHNASLFAKFRKKTIQMHTRNKKRTRRNLIIFSLSVLGSAVLARVVEPFTVPPGVEPGTPGLGQLLWLIAPLATMLLLRILGGDGWGDLGLRPNFRGNGFWWLASVLVFPVVITISVLLGALLGGLELDGNMLSAFAGALLPGLISAAIKNVFEEFAWRGYLAPRVYALNMNTWLSHAIIGVIWGAWHVPFVLVLWSYLTPAMLWAFVPLLLVGTVSQSVVYGEIRLATGSVWPAWVMHTVGNAFGNTLLTSGLIQLGRGRELWFSPGAEGVLGMMLMFALGYVLHRRRKVEGCTIGESR
jgi:membrane protease YdiL (CAAX protease family)